MKGTLLGADSFFIQTFFAFVIFPAFLLLILIYFPNWFYLFLKRHVKSAKILAFLSVWHQKRCYVIGVSFVILLFVTAKCLPIIDFMKNKEYIFIDVFDVLYKSPNRQNFQFPDKKRNLVVIILESMEKNYDDAKAYEENLIPTLSKIAQDNTSFQGHLQIYETSWTISAQLSLFCGMPRKTFVSFKTPDASSFLCWPQLLKENGYNTLWLSGYELNFDDTGKLAKRMGFSKRFGQNELLNAFNLGLHNIGLWGMNDKTIFEVAKIKINELAQKQQPFLITITSADTHFPDGYLNPGCPEKYVDMRDKIMCTDAIMNNFLNWLKKQPFYNQTTILIIGDHLAKNDTIAHLRYEMPSREPYGVIINSVLPNRIINKTHTTFDLAPTILNAIGIKIKDHKFGLGVSLYTSIPSWISYYKNKLKMHTIRNYQIYY